MLLHDKESAIFSSIPCNMDVDDMTIDQCKSLPLTVYPQKAINKCQDGWRKVIATAVTLGIPVPAFSSALAFYDGFRSERLPANLIQVFI